MNKKNSQYKFNKYSKKIKLLQNLYGGGNYIKLYHVVKSREILDIVINNGLSNPTVLGKPRPLDQKSGAKNDYIFFHPLRDNETYLHIPVTPPFFYVAIAVPVSSELNVNNRLYSFGVKPLKIIKLIDYIKMSIYPCEGLPEVRIKIERILPNFIIESGFVNSPTDTQIITKNDEEIAILDILPQNIVTN